MFRVAKRQPLVASALAKTQAKWRWARKWLDRNKSLPFIHSDGKDARPLEMRRCHPSLSSMFGGESTTVPKLLGQSKMIVKGKTALGAEGWANACVSRFFTPPPPPSPHTRARARAHARHIRLCGFWIANQRRRSEEDRARTAHTSPAERSHSTPAPRALSLSLFPCRLPTSSPSGTTRKKILSSSLELGSA